LAASADNSIPDSVDDFDSGKSEFAESQVDREVQSWIPERVVIVFRPLDVSIVVTDEESFRIRQLIGLVRRVKGHREK
jgi:hypothetical protein